MWKLAATVVVLAALAAGSLARADSGPIVYEDPFAGVATTTVDAELSDLAWALDAVFVGDPGYAEWRDRLLGCVAEQVRANGLPSGSVADVRASIISTLSACAERLGFKLPPGGLDRYFGLAGLGATPPGLPAPVCQSSGDPRIAEGAGRKKFTPEEWQQIKADYQKRDDEATKAFLEAEKRADAAADELKKVTKDPKATNEERAAAKKKSDDARNDAVSNSQKALEASRDNEAIQNTDPNSDEPAKPFPASETIREFGNICAAAAEQIAQCAQTGWATPDCQRIKAAAEGCTFVDPQVTDPVGPAYEEGTRCVAQPSEKELAAAVLRGCEERVHYGPDGGSPCAVAVANAAIAEEWYCTPYNGGLLCHTGGSNPCGASQTTPDPNGESCAGKVRVVAVRRSARDLISAVFGRLGGPVWSPPPPPPGPTDASLSQ
jgi:hypothetical protein